MIDAKTSSLFDKRSGIPSVHSSSCGYRHARKASLSFCRLAHPVSRILRNAAKSRRMRLYYQRTCHIPSRRRLEPEFRSCKSGMARAGGELGAAKTPKRAVSQSLLQLGTSSPALSQGHSMHRQWRSGQGHKPIGFAAKGPS